MNIITGILKKKSLQSKINEFGHICSQQGHEESFVHAFEPFCLANSLDSCCYPLIIRNDISSVQSIMTLQSYSDQIKGMK